MAISAAFMGLAVLGFKRKLWLVVGALAGHGVLGVRNSTIGLPLERVAIERT